MIQIYICGKFSEDKPVLNYLLFKYRIKYDDPEEF